jgi:hypothetical protein
MAFFAVVNPSTRKISMVGHCSADDLVLQGTGPGQKAVEITAAQSSVINATNWEWDEATSAFVQTVSDLDQAKTTRLLFLSSACANAIFAQGFTSSATGTALFYPSGPIDQTNMQAVAAAGGLLATQDSGGNWALTPHTAAEGMAVLGDFGTMRDTNRTKLTGLNADVAAATTIPAVNAVVW